MPSVQSLRGSVIWGKVVRRESQIETQALIAFLVLLLIYYVTLDFHLSVPQTFYTVNFLRHCVLGAKSTI